MPARRMVVVFLLCVARLSQSTYATHVVVTVPAATSADASIYLGGSTTALGLWKADGLKLSRQPDGTFAGEVDGPAEFKVTRGTWATVEKDAAGNEIGNRRLDAGAGELRVTVARWSEGGAPTTRASTVVGDLRIEQVGDAKRTIRVWLPPGYAAGDARYPVLYMHDGQNLFDAATSAFGVEWQVDETLTRLIETKAIPPIVVVGIDNTDRRIDEYTVTKDKRRGGDGEAYERFVIGVVKPHVDETFRTRPDRTNTFVGGSSLGGLISLDLIARHGDVFGGAIAMSPSIWWNGEAITRAMATPLPAAGTRIWLDMGGREGDEPAAEVERARRLDAVLARANATHRLTIDEAGQHSEAAWARRFPDAIRYLLSTDDLTKNAPSTKP